MFDMKCTNCDWKANSVAALNMHVQNFHVKTEKHDSQRTFTKNMESSHIDQKIKTEPKFQPPSTKQIKLNPIFPAESKIGNPRTICPVCKQKLQTNKGMKIHMTKSGCDKKPVGGKRPENLIPKTIFSLHQSLTTPGQECKNTADTSIRTEKDNVVPSEATPNNTNGVKKKVRIRNDIFVNKSNIPNENSQQINEIPTRPSENDDANNEIKIVKEVNPTSRPKSKPLTSKNNVFGLQQDNKPQLLEKANYEFNDNEIISDLITIVNNMCQKTDKRITGVEREFKFFLSNRSKIEQLIENCKNMWDKFQTEFKSDIQEIQNRKVNFNVVEDLIGTFNSLKKHNEGLVKDMIRQARLLEKSERLGLALSDERNNSLLTSSSSRMAQTMVDNNDVPQEVLGRRDDMMSYIAGTPGISNQIFKPHMNTAVTSKDNKILSTEIIQIDDDDEEDKIESASITEYVEPIKEHDVSKTTEILNKINEFDLHSDLFSSDDSEDEELDEDATNDDKNDEQKDSPEEFKENLNNESSSTSSHAHASDIETQKQDTETIVQKEKDNLNTTTDNVVKSVSAKPDLNNEIESEDVDIPSLYGSDEDFDDDTSDKEVEKTKSNANDKKVEQDNVFDHDTSDNEMKKITDDKTIEQNLFDKNWQKKSTEKIARDKLRAERNKNRVCTCGYTKELKEKVEIKREGSKKVYFKKTVLVGGKKKKRCGKCTGCKRPKCNKCNPCLKKQLKKACEMRACLNPRVPDCPCFE